MDKQTICLNGRLKEGDLVVAAPGGDYGCLIGLVKGIYYVGTPEHDAMTENPTDDVLVDFSNDYGDKRIEEIVEQFRDLYDDDEKTYDDIAIDEVVMSPDELLRIDMEKVGEKYYNSLLDSEARTAEWCFNELRNFINRQPKGTVYEVVVSFRLNDEDIQLEYEFNTECSAYECACRQYVNMLEKFGGQQGSYNYAGERGDSLFFAGGIRSDVDPKDCYSVRLNKYRWMKIKKTLED
jgi:hypothetical protein